MSTLRNLRERKGLTVSQLAAKASISSRVIIDYEEGRQTISLPHAKVLAKALWVGIDELMPPAGSVPPQPVSSSQVAQSAPVPTSAPQPAPAPRPQMAASAVAAPPAQRPTPTSMSAPVPAPSAPPQPRYDGARTVRPVSGDSHGGRSAPGGAKPAHPSRPAPPPPGPITEGQLEELRRLAVKLEIAEDQLEERVGKKLTDLNRPEAKAWIKRARAMAEEIAPSRKTPYGQWPEGREDQEAAYLKAQQEAGSFFFFKLFNGEQFGGVITDFTPYTITIKEQGSGNETVLRKLAVAYYRHAEAPAEKSSAPAKPSRSKARSQSTEEVHQPLDTGVDSDRKGEPAKPERDNMDEDRGV